jgi:hypothetical protein
LKKKIAEKTIKKIISNVTSILRVLQAIPSPLQATGGIFYQNSSRRTKLNLDN